jgi:hypothetical protein
MQFSSPNDESQSLILAHSEYIADVYAPSSGVFYNTSYAINPGLSNNFPFLAQFAVNFEEYELLQMVFEFHSTVDSAASSNSAGNTGTIIMATNYRADSPAFTNKEEMIQYHGGVSGRLTEQLTHGVECDPSKLSDAHKFVRNRPTTGDIKTFDHGIFQLAMQNIPSAFFNQQVGELWVYYKVKLSKPKLVAALKNDATEYRLLSSGSPSFANNNLFGTPLTALANNLSISQSWIQGSTGVDSRLVVTFSAQISGAFEIHLQVEGTGLNTLIGFNTAVSTGQVSLFRDIYCQAPGAALNNQSPTYISAVNTATYCYVIYHVFVSNAIGGVDNTVTVPLCLGAATGTVTQAALTVKEIGRMFWQSNQNAAPYWIDSSNNQITVN